MDPVQVLIGLAVGAVVGGLILNFLMRSKAQKNLASREQVLAEAKTEAEKLKSQAEQEVKRKAEEAERDLRNQRNELRTWESRLNKKEDAVEKRADSLQGKERNIENLSKNLERKDKTLQERSQEIDALVTQQKTALQQITGMSREEAIRMLMEKLDQETEKEKADLIRKRQEEAKSGAEQEAKRVIMMAIHRFAAEHTAEAVVTVVDLPSEEMKGRIIGREGRNIRAFERATGVDVIVDDTPGVIVLSAFDGVRREMARRSIEKLLFDGRIHPTRIEEITEQTKREMEEHIVTVGKEFLHEQDIHNVHPKLITLLGRLKYRTSYGQNVLQHVREVAHVCSVMSAEMGLDAKLGRRCGLFHDIGKAVDQEFEGSHPVIGGELLKRFDESKEVIDAAANHHNDPDAKFPYTILAAAADAISASRPGARGESMDRYIKRLEQLEAIAKAQQGVTQAYAIQAGREVRIIVDSEKITDAQAVIVARDIAKEIEKQLTYPGEVRVTVLRETRVIDYAR